MTDAINLCDHWCDGGKPGGHHWSHKGKDCDGVFDKTCHRHAEGAQNAGEGMTVKEAIDLTADAKP